MWRNLLKTKDTLYLNRMCRRLFNIVVSWIQLTYVQLFHCCWTWSGVIWCVWSTKMVSSLQPKGSSQSILLNVQVWNCLFPVANKSHWENHSPTGHKVTKPVNNEHCPFGLNPMYASSRHKNKANKSSSICIFIPDYAFVPTAPTVFLKMADYSPATHHFSRISRIFQADDTKWPWNMRGELTLSRPTPLATVITWC